ncbi:MAG: hypothetical protein GKR87_08420 [Kiritimatiellae bacterium]|nr:hypothetical protein [Kiritimatiellia bacterium]
MALTIKKLDLDAITRQGIEAFPNECCGFLIGEETEKGNRSVIQIVPATNNREEEAQHRRFLITPENVMKTEKYAREKSLDIIGFYHSHPNAPARPSDYDTEHAWPWYSYVITSIMNREINETTSWILQDDRSKFNEKEISVEE